MDAKLFSRAVAKINSQFVPAENSSEVLIKNIWRWLDAVHELGTPDEQPAFHGNGDPLHPVQYKPYIPESFRGTELQARLKSSEKGQTITEATGLSREASPCYGQVQILRRPLACHGPQDLRTKPRAGSTHEKRSVPLPLFVQEIHGETGRAMRKPASAQRTEDAGNTQPREPPHTIRFNNADPAGIDCMGKSVAKWVQRLQAHSKNATQRLLKRTK